MWQIPLMVFSYLAQIGFSLAFPISPATPIRSRKDVPESTLVMAEGLVRVRHSASNAASARDEEPGLAIA
jgi:hypothetical protein